MGHNLSKLHLNKRSKTPEKDAIELINNVTDSDNEKHNALFQSSSSSDEETDESLDDDNQSYDESYDGSDDVASMIVQNPKSPNYHPVPISIGTVTLIVYKELDSIDETDSSQSPIPIPSPPSSHRSLDSMTSEIQAETRNNILGSYHDNDEIESLLSSIDEVEFEEQYEHRECCLKFGVNSVADMKRYRRRIIAANASYQKMYRIKNFKPSHGPSKKVLM